jgi:hypothetical protein
MGRHCLKGRCATGVADAGDRGHAGIFERRSRRSYAETAEKTPKDFSAASA